MAYELFIDGFDYYATADLTKKWQSYSGTVDVSATSGRRSGGCLRMEDSTLILSKSTNAVSRATIGFALFIPASNPDSGLTISFRSIFASQFEFTLFPTTWRWSAARPGSGTSVNTTNGLQIGVWNYIEAGVYLADAGTFELRVNGSSVGWLPSTNYDTLINAGAKIDNIGIGRINAVSTAKVLIDDLYITYGDEIKFIGDSRVDTLALTANSSPQDWTPDTGNAWERLNQDAGYISSDTINATSLFAAGNLSHNPSTIHGVQINGHAYKTDAGSREAAMVLKSGTTTDVGTSLALSTDTLLIREPHIVDPDTGVAFTKAGVDGMEVGVKVTA